MTSSRDYANPYWCGFALGLVLLSTYALAGRGLGASGAFASAASGLVAAAAPGVAGSNGYFAGYLGERWLVFEMLGLLLGGLASAWLSGRFRLSIRRGPAVGARTRLAAAVAGGSMMGVGAMLARGCTSGQALTGGALLSAGSWLFVSAVFLAGFAAAQLAGRLWR